MRKECKKKEKGITLTGLVITIIVLIILAGISLSYFIQEGIIDKAEEAGERMNQAAGEEAEGLKNLSNEIEGLISGVVIPEGAISIGEVEWEEGKASVEVSTDTGYEIEWQKEGEESWNKVANGGKIEGLEHGDIIFIRLTDGRNVGEESTVRVEDKTAPTVSISETGKTSSSITVQVEATDDETGMEENPTYTYYYKVSGQPDTSYQQASQGTSTTCTINGLTQGTKYTVKVEVADNAGNVGSGTVDIIIPLPEGWNPEKVKDVVTEVVEEEELHAPIPDGFTASKVDGEDTISDGLVIYETEEEVNSSNHDIALTTYNQYVWIPVTEINDMVMCKSKTANTQCHIIRVDDEGSPNGFYLKCETHNSTDLAGKLYEGRPDFTDTDDGGMIITEEMDPNQTDQAYNPNSGYREPAIVTNSDTGDGTKYDGDPNNYHGLANAQAFLTQLNNDFNDMVKSVYTYGGFYVGRYEMGEGGSTKKGQTVLTAEGDSGNMWYGLYNVARQKGEAINREMIWRMPV